MPVSSSIRKSAGFVSRLYLTESSVFPGALTGRLRAVALVLACLLVGLAPGQLHAQNVTQVPYITTVAGTGTAGYNGDNIVATSAELNGPFKITADAAGNVYIADTNNNRIRKVDVATGYITTVAGNGTAGSTGDGELATSAELNVPAVAVEASGNIYIADFGNNRVRVVCEVASGPFCSGKTVGFIYTVAGNGTWGYNGDNIAATSAEFRGPDGVAIDGVGNLYIADRDNQRIRVVCAAAGGPFCSGGTVGDIYTVAGNGFSGYTGDDTAATSTELASPIDIVVDAANNLYIADSDNQRVRVVCAVAGGPFCSGKTVGFIYTVAGNGTGGYNGDNIAATSAELFNPIAMSMDSLGNLYIADPDNERTRVVCAVASGPVCSGKTVGYIYTVAGTGTPGYNGDGGPATSAEPNYPDGVALDGAGDIYIADSNNSRIRKVVTGPVPFFNVSVGGTDLGQLVRLSVSNTITLTNTANPQVSLGDYTPTFHNCISWGADSTLCEWNVIFAPTKPGPRWGSFVVADNGGTKYSFGLEGAGVGPAVAFTPGIINTAAGNGTMAYSGDGSAATTAGVHNPVGVAVDNVGNLYISENGNDDYRVRRVDVATGIINTVAGTGPATGAGGPVGEGIQATATTLYYPSGLALDSVGNLYIADTDNFRVRKVDANGFINTVAGGGTGCAQGYDVVGDGCPATSVPLYGATGVAVGSAGVLYIVDNGESRIRKVDTNGIISTVAGTGTAGYSGDGGLATNAALNYPRNAALDSGGNLYIADTMNYSIRKVDVNGFIRTIAGNGSKGNTPDGSVAAGNPIGAPFAVAVDAAGDVYFADMDNLVIRKVDPDGLISTVAGTGVDGYSGDGGPALNAQFAANGLQGLAVDNAGNLYIVDSFNNRVRKVDVSTSTMAFGNVDVGQSSNQQHVDVSNVGNSLLNVANVAVTAPFTGQFLGCGTTSAMLGVGRTCALTSTFAPITAGYATGTIMLTDDAFNGSQTLNVSGTGIVPVTPVITWPAPVAITYGTPLGATQLNATTSVPGTFTYTPPAGTVLNAGANQTLSVTFTPYDSVTYTQATKNVTIQVNPAVLTVAADNQVMGAGSVGILQLTYSIYGYVNGDTPTSVGIGGAPLLSTSALINSSTPAGTYAIVVGLGDLSLTPPPNYTFAFLPGTLTVSPNALNFMDNYFVTGDYVAAGVNLLASTPDSSNHVTGPITIQGVPDGSDIVAAFLYWQTIETTSSPSGEASFNGYSITGNVLGSDLPLDSWGKAGSVMRSYRADVYPLVSVPNATNQVTLPAPAAGASLVVIYRVLSNQPPLQPQLKGVVIHDGAWLPANSSQQMTQTVRGYYDAVSGASANVTSIYSTPAGWVHSSSAKTLQSTNGSQYTDTEPSGAWSVLVFSVPVNNSDNDGLLDAWKRGPVAPDTHAGQPGYYDVGNGVWVDLAGAQHGQQDLFVQLDYMVGADGHSHYPTQDALNMVQNAYAAHGIQLHLVAGNQILEDTCKDDFTATPPVVCVFPNEPGVVAWKWGLEMMKAWPINPDSCAILGGDCTPRFQVGRKDSYHYVLFGHSVSSPSWSVQAGTLNSIVVSSGWATVTTSARLADQYGNVPCPTRVMIDGAIVTPDLNGIYDVLPAPGAAGPTGCPSDTTFTFLVRPDSSVNVPDGTYPGVLAEPQLAIYTSKTDTTSGFSDVGGSDSAITLGKWPPPLGTWPSGSMTTNQVIATEAGTLFHEIGHTLGLTHGGRFYPNGNVPAYEPNCKPNYQSVMNYLFQFDLLGDPDNTHPYGYLDYSDRALSRLGENNLSPWPALITPAFQTTKWYSSSQPPNPNSSVATYCDGTPVGLNDTKMWVWLGTPDWPAGTALDINFDRSRTQLDGYSDWGNIDLRQVGAFAIDYVSIAALLGDSGGHYNMGGGGGHYNMGGGGGHFNMGGGGGHYVVIGGSGGGHFNMGGGGGHFSVAGGGGHFNMGGGGGHFNMGGGGGHFNMGGGGGHAHEINYETADSYPRSPRALTTTGGTITWYAPNFGNIQEYIIYRVSGGTTTAIACVVVGLAANCPPGTIVVPGNPNATTYSYTDPNWSAGETYFVTTVDIGPSGATRESTPARQHQAPLTLTAASPLTYNTSETLNTTGGTTKGTVTYYLLSGACSLTGSQLTANSGTGSCMLTATMAGNSSYDAVTSTTVAVNLTKAPLTITANNATKFLGGANPMFTATYSGFVNGEGPGILTGTLSCTSTAVTSSPVGTYPINCSGQSSPNYAVTYVPGTLTVLYVNTGMCHGDAGHQILQPVNADGTSTFKQGSAVPAKFRVCDVSGVSIGTPGVVSSFNLVKVIKNTTTQTIDEAIYSSTPDTAFRWDSTAQQWIFNISTKNLATHATYVYSIGLNDGTSISFQFGLPK